MADGVEGAASLTAILHRQMREERVERRARVHMATKGKNDDGAVSSSAPLDD
jgi:hypothetical protein